MGSRTVPIYSISEDSAWHPTSMRDSGAPSVSVYSEDFDRRYRHSSLPSVQPLRIQKTFPPPNYPHPHQLIHDHGQQVRTSRLPLFSQVRTMLHRPPNINGNAVNVRWDEYSGEISADGIAPQIKPSSYINPYDEITEARPRPSGHLTRLQSTRSLSPVSTLREDELEAIAPIVIGQHQMRSESPVSSASVSPIDDELILRIPLTRPRVVDISAAASCDVPSEVTPTNITPPKLIRRKPVSGGKTALSSNGPTPDTSPYQAKNSPKPDSHFGSPNPKSRFSWTTYDQSVIPDRPSLDTTYSTSSPPRPDAAIHSRFSWSTWTTGNTPRIRSDSPPPSPPPPLPRKYANPPVQSILSRARPIQRADREEHVPLPSPPPPQPVLIRNRKSVNVPRTPTFQKRARNLKNSQQSDASRLSGSKKLPLPPPPLGPISHLDGLLSQQENLAHQRRNMEKLIAEDLKMERLSPLDLSFNDFKNVKRRLSEHRATLDQIQVEEREVGIAISRARRKEGEEEGLWVRRVTS